MSWTVTIRNPTNTTALATVEDGLAGGEVVLRGFDAPIVTPPGSGRVLNLYARQASLSVPPRAIVQFAIDATPVFWGPAVVVPALDSPGAGPFDQDRDALERITVVGGEQLAKDSVVGPRLFEEDTDVAAIALELCELYAHPALTVTAGNFPATGAVLSVWYLPEQTLAEALGKLAETVPGGAEWWVDAAGAVHFEALEAGS
jgi:hypothetical protein